MLLKIIKIENFGRFKKHINKVEFEPITLIFGRNTYGKSTLSDLFLSLGTDNIDVIESRKTINSKDNELPQISIAFRVDEQLKEYCVNYSNGKWFPKLQNIKFNIFDDSFYHKNLFTGKKFTRENKVNFSSFILGSQGVEKRIEIERKNKQQGAATRRKNQLKKDVFKSIDNLDEFLKLLPLESIAILDDKVAQLTDKYKELNKQKENINEIKNRKECKVLVWDNCFLEKINEFNIILKKSLVSHHEEASKQVVKHIEINFKEYKNAETWIRQGLSQNNGVACQFCGQSLSSDALHLLNTYQECFNEIYETHDKSIRMQLEKSKNLLISNMSSSIKIDLANNNGILLIYSELMDNQCYLNLKIKSEELSNSLNEIFNELDIHREDFETELNNSINEKIQSPHQIVKSINADRLLGIHKEITKKISDYNLLVYSINEIILHFKNTLNENSINNQIKNIILTGKIERRNLQRLQLSEQCLEYIKLNEEINKLNLEIPELENKLIIEQSDYLANYFEKINCFFKKFGSNDFELVKDLDTNGHEPIYCLKVKFHGTDISEKSLDRVFSESDRRALALAVFWASLNNLTDLSKKNTILVFDDPVTSFDNHRISAVHREIINASSEFRQIILLSHFEQGIISFLNTHKNEKIKLLSIEKNGHSSEIVASDIQKFIKGTHEKKRDEIFTFINNKRNNCSAGDLRIFFELEIAYRFAKQLNSINGYEKLDF